jgi:hypothetical protein
MTKQAERIQDTSPAERLSDEGKRSPYWQPPSQEREERRRSDLAELLDRPKIARGLSDIDDPLEGCDLTVRSITYGRIGDPAGTHTRAQCKAVSVKLFGFEPTWPREWVGSRQEDREDGEEEGREIE